MKNKYPKYKLKFVSIFDRIFKGKYCWADCVSFAFSNTRWNPFKIDSSKGCETESKEHSDSTCYCGSWQNGICFAKLSKKEQQKIRDEINNQPIQEPEFPF